MLISIPTHRTAASCTYSTATFARWHFLLSRLGVGLTQGRLWILLTVNHDCFKHVKTWRGLGRRYSWPRICLTVTHKWSKPVRVHRQCTVGMSDERASDLIFIQIQIFGRLSIFAWVCEFIPFLGETFWTPLSFLTSPHHSGYSPGVQTC